LVIGDLFPFTPPGEKNKTKSLAFIVKLQTLVQTYEPWPDILGKYDHIQKMKNCLYKLNMTEK